MSHDKANIFKLSEQEKKLYFDDPFRETFENVKEFAEGLKQDVLNRQTPSISMLEANFGMGKTHFSTRFTEYLRKNNIDSIYYSAWENDYLPDPFIVFAKELTHYFNNYSITKKITGSSIEVGKAAFGLAKDLIKATNISLPVGTTGLSVDLSGDSTITALEDFVGKFKEEKDPVLKFKEDFQQFINNLKSNRLVLIIDELDRCRPDYAMKTLEIVKHFFDIEGLVIIFPTNESSMKKCVQALYGIDEDKGDKKTESYMKKFFNTPPYKIPEPNYNKFVENYIIEEKLAPAILKGNVTTSDSQKYSFRLTLTDSIAIYSKEALFTIRETKQACDHAIHICNNFDSEIYVEYLGYLVCNLLSEKSLNFKAKYHPLFEGIGKLKNLLSIQLPDEVRQNKIGSVICTFHELESELRNKSFDSFSKKIQYIEAFQEKDTKYFKHSSGTIIYHSTDEQILNNVKKYLLEHIQELKQYEQKWEVESYRSDLVTKYKDIVENCYKLFLENKDSTAEVEIIESTVY